MQLAPAIELFLGEHKPTTQQAYRRPLEMMRDWIGPARELSGIRPELVLEYFQVVVKPRDYAAATERKHAKSIKTFFNWCTNLDLVEKSPARMLKAHRVPRRISREKAMRDDELTAVLDYLRYKAIPRDFALVLFLADTGCRRGGAAGLRVQDVDFETLTAIVTEKGDKSRRVAFSAQCSKALLHWLAYRSAHYQIIGVYVFSRDGQPVAPELISRQVRRACLKVGVRSMGSHSLRHRKGHQLADARVAPSIAATALGHSSAMITVEHYYPDDWESAEKALRELMTDAPAIPKIVNFSDKI